MNQQLNTTPLIAAVPTTSEQRDLFFFSKRIASFTDVFFQKISHRSWFKLLFKIFWNLIGDGFRRFQFLRLIAVGCIKVKMGQVAALKCKDRLYLRFPLLIVCGACPHT